MLKSKKKKKEVVPALPETLYIVKEVDSAFHLFAVAEAVEDVLDGEIVGVYTLQSTHKKAVFTEHYLEDVA